MKSNSKIKSVVDNDMCIGCGLCSVHCSSDAIKIEMNKYGFYTANVVGTCNCNGQCIKVCPFNPNPEKKVRTENEISEIFLGEANKYHNEIGRYINTYAGYSVKNRLSSSSGGIATYVLTELMKRGDIQHVISVKAGDASIVHYEYSISSSVEELINTSKTKYYPVTLATVLQNLEELDGKVAIVGVACFIKAIRLAQVQNQTYKDKIGFLIGIICGGVKSSFFTEYLASKSGVAVNEFSAPDFRIKDLNSTASDYSFGCLDNKNNQKTIKMRTIGDMWGSGLFKANACDFCDDVTTELADLSVGDAWLQPFSNDGRGTNVIITRLPLADIIIKAGMDNGDLVVSELSEDIFLASQQGSFNHRRDGLRFRIKRNKNICNAIPPKRYDQVKISPLVKIIQFMRMHTRRKSLKVWEKTKTAEKFDQEMALSLFLLKFFTTINHYQRAIFRKLSKALAK
ncbi:4Fe-4S ferredoxin [Photobacterium phosphoreum]|uniref:Coenzyme F420 hydrogenase/dehydrogenase, beta subunit C-terminal domain n=1 Tax=Photobacterium phosphoreum TaxID=659 RepID=UPI000D164E50|nr:Coenzyme F420 hydrogenase/dehydrogenase, beta subunit C-terminal domain [Photobacterium phosphoreum]PSW28739.1 4Fe-4S ferredoxin [Photobacterium phosphoreum]